MTVEWRKQSLHSFRLLWRTLLLTMATTGAVYCGDSGALGELLHKGAAAMKEQHYDIAIAFFDSVLKQNPPDEIKLSALFNRGFANSFRGDEIAALTDFNSVIELHPPPMLAAKVLMARGVLQVRHCEREAGLADVESAVKTDPANPECYRARALVRFRYFGLLGQAMDDMNKALEIAKSMEADRADKEMATTYTERGEKHLALQQYQLALADFDAALKRKRMARGYIGRGKVWLAAGDIEAARTDAEAALVLVPEDRDATELMAQIALCDGDTQKAGALLSRTANLTALALLDFFQGKDEAALRRLEKFMANAPCESEALRTHGMLKYVLRGPIDAMQSLEKSTVVQAVPDLSWSIYLLAATETGKRDQVLTRLERIISVYPEDLWARQLIELASARRSLEMVLEHVGQDIRGTARTRKAEAEYVMGELELVRGDRLQARLYFKEALLLECKFSLVQSLAARRLDQLSSAGK